MLFLEHSVVSLQNIAMVEWLSALLANAVKSSRDGNISLVK